MNITIVNKVNIGCRVKGIPSEQLSGHLLVVTYDITDDKTFKGCNNYFFDYYAHHGFFAKGAQKDGAAAVFAIRDHREVKV